MLPGQLCLLANIKQTISECNLLLTLISKLAAQLSLVIDAVANLTENVHQQSLPQVAQKLKSSGSS